MNISRRIVFETETDIEEYQVIEEIYTNRYSRILYSGKDKTAQSGIPLDSKDLMLFEYNQRLVELISQSKPKKILAIGGGALTLPSYISKKYQDIHFDVIEPDKQLEKIASEYFNYSASDKVVIINDYGLHYLKKTRKSYDLIIIDAYLDNQMPNEIMTKKFAKLVVSALNIKGAVALNVISSLQADSAINQIHRTYSKNFKIAKLYPAGPDKTFYYPTNYIYVLSNYPFKLRLKYPALSLESLGNYTTQLF